MVSVHLVSAFAQVMSRAGSFLISSRMDGTYLLPVIING